MLLRHVCTFLGCFLRCVRRFCGTLAHMVAISAGSPLIYWMCFPERMMHVSLPLPLTPRAPLPSLPARPTLGNAEADARPGKCNRRTHVYSRAFLDVPRLRLCEGLGRGSGPSPVWPGPGPGPRSRAGPNGRRPMGPTHGARAQWALAKSRPGHIKECLIVYMCPWMQGEMQHKASPTRHPPFLPLPPPRRAREQSERGGRGRGETGRRRGERGGEEEEKRSRAETRPIRPSHEPDPPPMSHELCSPFARREPCDRNICSQSNRANRPKRPREIGHKPGPDHRAV